MHVATFSALALGAVLTAAAAHASPLERGTAPATVKSTVSPPPPLNPPMRSVHVDKHLLFFGGKRVPSMAASKFESFPRLGPERIALLWQGRQAPAGSVRAAVTVRTPLERVAPGYAMRTPEVVDQPVSYTTSGNKPREVMAIMRCVSCGELDPRSFGRVVREPLRADGKPYFTNVYREARDSSRYPISAYVEKDGQVYQVTQAPKQLVDWDSARKVAFINPYSEVP